MARFGGTRLEDAGLREARLPVGGLGDARLREAGFLVAVLLVVIMRGGGRIRRRWPDSQGKSEGIMERQDETS